jgi:hypothetical protein
MTIHILGKDVRRMMAGGVVPDLLKQSGVLLQFVEPIPATEVSEFYRIQLNQISLGRAEERPYFASVWQPQRVAPKFCRKCRRSLVQKSEMVWRCEWEGCPERYQSLVDGPVRGVVSVLLFEDFIVGSELEEGHYSDGEPYRIEYDLADRVFLALDRRYEADVLQGVWRIAGEICEMKGWKLK